MKKIIKNPLFIMVLAIAFLLGSSVGASRAAIVYQSNEDKVKFELAEVSVGLMENGSLVEDKEATDSTAYTYGLSFGLEEGETFKIGKKYDEEVSVVNNSSAEYGYDEYVRVIITKSWYNTATGKKVTSLDPSLIDLNIMTDQGWILDTSASTTEQSVYYLDAPVPQGGEVKLADSLLVSDKVTDKVTKNGTTGDITTSYDYDGMSFYVDIEVDAVQTHNAVDAIKGAWGVDVNIDSEGRLSLK